MSNMSSEEHKPRHDHERSDWTMKYVFWSAIALVISVFVLCAGSWWIFRQLQASAAARQMGTAREEAGAPANPKLQVAPADDWNQMLTNEREFLNSYGWIDRSRGIVHIPIRRAMELLAERGVPAAPEGGRQK